VLFCARKDDVRPFSTFKIIDIDNPFYEPEEEVKSLKLFL
jgi:hypothetical protein